MQRDCHVLIVGAAPAVDDEMLYAAFITAAEIVIAADGGVGLCRRAGRVPDICVGDFDSVSLEDLTWAEECGSRVVRFSSAKDESDLDLAVKEARAMNAQQIDFIAAFTGRLDHTLASLGTLIRTVDVNARGFEADMMLYPLSLDFGSTLVLPCRYGCEFSVYSIGGPAVVTITGARYPLKSVRLEPLSSHGLNNVIESEDVVIVIEDGTGIVVVSQTPEIGLFSKV